MLSASDIRLFILEVLAAGNIVDMAVYLFGIKKEIMAAHVALAIATDTINRQFVAIRLDNVENESSPQKWLADD
jgi:hypothetical protein